ncbi:hypothetical protein DFJ73DRAFT_842019 [Zopfochytrium polystomum]|nr:hypothetical protein DFJ73DRAFT_842019 [Zopfochytrium polystomum]
MMKPESVGLPEQTLSHLNRRTMPTVSQERTSQPLAGAAGDLPTSGSGPMSCSAPEIRITALSMPGSNALHYQMQRPPSEQHENTNTSDAAFCPVAVPSNQSAQLAATAGGVPLSPMMSDSPTFQGDSGYFSLGSTGSEAFSFPTSTSGSTRNGYELPTSAPKGNLGRKWSFKHRRPTLENSDLQLPTPLERESVPPSPTRADSVAVASPILRRLSSLPTVADVLQALSTSSEVGKSGSSDDNDDPAVTSGRAAAPQFDVRRPQKESISSRVLGSIRRRPAGPHGEADGMEVALDGESIASNNDTQSPLSSHEDVSPLTRNKRYLNINTTTRGSLSRPRPSEHQPQLSLSRPSPVLSLPPSTLPISGPTDSSVASTPTTSDSFFQPPMRLSELDSLHQESDLPTVLDLLPMKRSLGNVASIHSSASVRTSSILVGKESTPEAKKDEHNGTPISPDAEAIAPSSISPTPSFRPDTSAIYSKNGRCLRTDRSVTPSLEGRFDFVGASLTNADSRSLSSDCSSLDEEFPFDFSGSLGTSVPASPSACLPLDGRGLQSMKASPSNVGASSSCAGSVVGARSTISQQRATHRPDSELGTPLSSSNFQHLLVLRNHDDSGGSPIPDRSTEPVTRPATTPVQANGSKDAIKILHATPDVYFNGFGGSQVGLAQASVEQGPRRKGSIGQWSAISTVFRRKNSILRRDSGQLSILKKNSSPDFRSQAGTPVPSIISTPSSPGVPDGRSSSWKQWLSRRSSSRQSFERSTPTPTFFADADEEVQVAAESPGLSPMSPATKWKKALSRFGAVFNMVGRAQTPSIGSPTAIRPIVQASELAYSQESGEMSEELHRGSFNWTGSRNPDADLPIALPTPQTDYAYLSSKPTPFSRDDKDLLKQPEPDGNRRLLATESYMAALNSARRSVESSVHEPTLKDSSSGSRGMEGRRQSSADLSDKGGSSEVSLLTGIGSNIRSTWLSTATSGYVAVSAQVGAAESETSLPSHHLNAMGRKFSLMHSHGMNGLLELDAASPGSAIRLWAAGSPTGEEFGPSIQDQIDSKLLTENRGFFSHGHCFHTALLPKPPAFVNPQYSDLDGTGGSLPEESVSFPTQRRFVGHAIDLGDESSLDAGTFRRRGSDCSNSANVGVLWRPNQASAVSAADKRRRNEGCCRLGRQRFEFASFLARPVESCRSERCWSPMWMRRSATACGAGKPWAGLFFTADRFLGFRGDTFPATNGISSL